MLIESAGHNENESHLMSIETCRSRKSSCFLNGEDCKEETEQSSGSFQPGNTHAATRRTVLREPNAGNRHVRFDEGRKQTIIGFVHQIVYPLPILLIDSRKISGLIKKVVSYIRSNDPSYGKSNKKPCYS